jgi:hypothetical protein
MAVTVRQLLNRVLVNLGETKIDDSTPVLSTDYTRLLANFLNTIKEEVEDTHNWRALRVTDTVSVSALATSTAISWANERSRVVRVQNTENCGEVPLVFDITTASNPTPLQEMDIAEYLYRSSTDPATTGQPEYFALDNTGGDALSLLLWPIPSSSRTIQLTLCVPAARYEDDDLDEVIAIPASPLEMGVTWYAMEERGEELGVNALFSEQRYANMLNAHVSRDLAEQGEAQLVVT